MSNFNAEGFVERLNALRSQYIKSSYNWFTTLLKPKGIGNVKYYHLIGEAYTEDGFCIIPMKPMNEHTQGYPVNLENMQHSLDNKGIIVSIDYNEKSAREELSFSKTSVHIPETPIEKLVKMFAQSAIENLYAKDFEIAPEGQFLRVQKQNFVRSKITNTPK